MNKALRSGVSVVREDIGGDRFGGFLSIYADTMSRRSAKEAFFFKEEFYRKLETGLPGRTHVFYSLIGERQYQRSWCFAPRQRSTPSWGNQADYFEFRPNNLLKHEIIRWGQGQRILEVSSRGRSRWKRRNIRV